MCSIQYNSDGKFTFLDDVWNGKPFYRKYFNNNNEYLAYQKIYKNPHPNIVNIFKLDKNYVDLELLNTHILNTDIDKIIIDMIKVKEHLQSIGIIHLNWTTENIGFDSHKNFKLFDFNCCGIINQYDKSQWLSRPNQTEKYNLAKKKVIIYLKKLTIFVFITVLKF